MAEAKAACDKTIKMRRNSFVPKILTSNPYAFKILQTIFAEPAPVKAFEGVGGRGYSQTGPDFPKTKWRNHPVFALIPIFSDDFPQASLRVLSHSPRVLA